MNFSRADWILNDSNNKYGGASGLLGFLLFVNKNYLYSNQNAISQQVFISRDTSAE